MYYRNNDDMGICPMMREVMCPAMQGGICPMAQAGVMHNMQMPNMQMPQSNPYSTNMPQNNMYPMMEQTENMKHMQGMEAKDDCVDEKQVEMLYPEIYFKIYPLVKHHCDMMEEKHGKHHCPCKEELDEMITKICKKVDKDEEKDDNKEHKDCEKDEDNKRQYGRRQLFRDLVGIMLIDELIGRRRIYPYTYPYPYYGY